jgi:hypothetical protein
MDTNGSYIVEGVKYNRYDNIREELHIVFELVILFLSTI